MAEFLVFNKENWMDLPSRARPDLIGYENVQRKINEDSRLDSAQKAVKQEAWTIEYNARSQLGDIVEAREDGFGLCGDEPLSFALIKVPEILLIDAKLYEGAIVTKNLEKEVVINYNHKSSLDMTKITLVQNEAILTLSQFNSILTEKI